ncbi:MAG: HAMP domain-containing histidine kinase [Bacteroidetes bacterium]|nr:HAMP domain-containing histidine kinase [Bacteroidota bacterium]MBU1719740.1 HAMP domain-containing histidine kinase [Bacteroidota bacterium]
MKLLAKTSIINFLIIAILLIAGGFFVFSQLRAFIDEEVTENLYNQKTRIEQFVADSVRLPHQTMQGADIILFQPTNNSVLESVIDTTLYNSLEEETQPYRMLRFQLNFSNQSYSVVVAKPVMESDDLVETLTTTLGITGAVLLALLLITTWLVSRRLWKPFYTTLSAVQQFQIRGNKSVLLEKPSTREFRMLNQELEKLMSRILDDYRNLKEFTENASHEIQTPLAIIRTRLEQWVQSEHLPHDDQDHWRDISEATNRLSRLNSSLLLLAKIENRQFVDSEDVPFQELIENQLHQTEEMISHRHLIVELDCTEEFSVAMNRHLATILVSNLIGNAVRHNVEHGTIKVSCTSKGITIANTGEPPLVPVEKLMQRFQKSDPAADSTGLGLAISRQICDTYMIAIDYRFENGLHIIEIRK